MNAFINPLYEATEYSEILQAVKAGTLPVNISGPSDSQKVHLAFSICRHLNLRGLFIAHNEMQARRAYEDFSFFLGEEVLLFPAKEIMLHDVEAKSHEDVFQRIAALDGILEGRCKLVITSPEALLHKLPPQQDFRRGIQEIAVGHQVDLLELSRSLVTSGYERVDAVEARGQFAVRGGIVDLYPIHTPHAIRIELFGDEVDSIRSMDVMSQRSMEKMERARIIPAREVVYPPEEREGLLAEVRRDLSAQLAKAGKSDEYRQKLLQHIESDMEKISDHYYFPGMDRYIPYMLKKPATLLDYIQGGTVVFVDEPARFRQRVENMLMENHETCQGMLEKGQILAGSMDLLFDYHTLCRSLEAFRTVTLNTMNVRDGMLQEYRSYSIVCKLMGSYQGYLDLLMEDIRNWKAKGSRIVVLSGTRGRGERLVEALRARDMEALYTEDMDSPLQAGQVLVTHGSLNKGFEYPSIGLVVISDKEAFGRDKKIKKAAAAGKGAKIHVFTDLNVGDYVVHQSHGIGQYMGIQKLAVDNVKKDYLKIRYNDGGYLYIPSNQLDLIQKYIGSEGKAPKLNKLGGTEWVKAKKRVKDSLRELAAELIKLYAQRQAVHGFTYSPDTVWQTQFEEMFPYQETEDQLKCIEEIKRDMEISRPMDRLLCGDVGYGKTEVAARAVFKAAMDSKQVAYLVPTTILAQQQYSSFKERMKDFPVTVDVISRFRSPAEQKKILREVKAGNVDILIGTHRLLQKDIQFKDLGLLVVDEEQRFGVDHKEKLKSSMPNVDVLTLTATPIPRTLHMSLVGIRDISVIEDPPEERYPVQTYVMEHNKEVIQDAINRELARNGQVFYLYNRVRSIQLKASEIQALVPEARVAVAHGQMNEKQLEDIMLSFIHGEYDILVCTTIIESGLDMPNVNTIIVEDADRMGLAQLYQIRGRVGRSNRVAFAYITYRRDKVLTEIAEKRLQAIKEFTELGSGFKIAMRDLEIRGAGNLLGPEQHGHMESVGYDMYCRLLDEAVREMQGADYVDTRLETTVDINISAYIDDEYIGVENQKIEMYKKIASIENQQDVTDIADELVDRYGDPPREVENLMDIAYIKAMARELGFSAVNEKGDSILLQLGQGKKMNLEVMSRLSAKYRRQLLFNAGSSPYILYKIAGMSKDKVLDNIKILLQDIKSFEV